MDPVSNSYLAFSFCPLRHDDQTISSSCPLLSSREQSAAKVYEQMLHFIFPDTNEFIEQMTSFTPPFVSYEEEGSDEPAAETQERCINEPTIKVREQMITCACPSLLNNQQNAQMAELFTSGLYFYIESQEKQPSKIRGRPPKARRHSFPRSDFKNSYFVPCSKTRGRTPKVRRHSVPKSGLENSHFVSSKRVYDLSGMVRELPIQGCKGTSQRFFAEGGIKNIKSRNQ